MAKGDMPHCDDDENALGPSQNQNGPAIRLKAGQVPKSNGPTPPCLYTDEKAAHEPQRSGNHNESAPAYGPGVTP